MIMNTNFKDYRYKNIVTCLFAGVVFSLELYMS